MNEYEKVKEEIANLMREQYQPDIVPNFDGWANSILSIVGIAILSDDQTWPENPYFRSGHICSYDRAIEDMLSANFYRIVKKEGK